MRRMGIGALRSAVAAGLLATAAAAQAATTVVAFDDPAISGPLSTQYAGFGVTFAQSGGFSTARPYNDARDTFDQRGYFGTAERGNPTVLFDAPVDNLSFDFVSLGVALFAFALDDQGQILEVISEALPTGTAVTNGTRSFTAGGISGFRIANIDQRLGISTLRFDGPVGVAGVPEPASWALMLIGFGAIGGAVRRRGTGEARVRLA